MFTRILIPLDGSLLAEQAIPHAEQIARIFGARIVLLRILDVDSQEDPYPISTLSWQIRRAEAEVYLREIAARIDDQFNAAAGEAGVETAHEALVECVIREGRTADQIIDFALNENIDLLVISSHGSGGLSRWNLSSVIQKVIDLVYLPLLIVRSYNRPEEASGPIEYHRILLPFDSSLRAEFTLPIGILLAQGVRSPERKPAAGLIEKDTPAVDAPLLANDPPANKLFIASVIKPPEIPLPQPYPFEVGILSDQLLEVSRQAVHSYLEKIKQRLPVESEIRVVENSDISAAIQKIADQENIDLVLMSAHGYSGQYTHPYGSVTRNIIETGTHSVLILQDMPRSQVRPTAAGKAAGNKNNRFQWQEAGLNSSSTAHPFEQPDDTPKTAQQASESTE